MRDLPMRETKPFLKEPFFQRPELERVRARNSKAQEQPKQQPRHKMKGIRQSGASAAKLGQGSRLPPGAAHAEFAPRGLGVTIALASDKSGKMSDGKMKDQRITVRLPAELRLKLKETARLRGTRESDLVRESVELRLTTEDSQPTAYELAKKAGLIGIVRGASPDLSVNRKHFKGFGGS